MTKPISIIGRGPAIRGFDPWNASTGKMQQLFTEDEWVRLASDCLDRSIQKR